MNGPGHFSESPAGESGEETRGFEVFARLKDKLEIVVVQTAENAGFSVDVPFDDEFPVAAPEKCSEMHIAGLFVRIARIECKERYRGVTADADAAFKNALSGCNFGTPDAVFLSPFPLQGCEARSLSAGHAPGSGKEGFNAYGRIASVDNFHMAPDEIEFREKFVVQIDGKRGCFIEQ